jgi:uncharacterized protein (DUF952 family)
MQTEALVARLSGDRVYKVLRGSEWEALRQGAFGTGSFDDQRDGYIHLSTAAQLAGTLARYYADTADLWLVSLDPLVLGDALRWEPSRGGQRFPHLYGVLLHSDCNVVADRPRPDSGWRGVATDPA